MEIGYPTDVRHVTHIGWGSSSMNAPSWVRIKISLFNGICYSIKFHVSSVF